MMDGAFFIPPKGAFDEAIVWRWYQNINVEFDDAFLEVSRQRNRSEHYLKTANPTFKKLYFRRHFCRTFAEAARFLMGGRPNPHIVDLGCGIGSQSLFLALKGARITGIDMDGKALGIFRERKALYERLAGRPLAIELIAGNSLDVDYARLAPIDGVYSMFAFNMMQPSARLVDAMMAGFASDARFAVLDGNNQSLHARLVPTRRRAVWPPDQFAAELTRRGFSVRTHKGGVSLPPALWRAGPVLATPLDDLRDRSWLFANSHQILAELKADQNQRPTPRAQ